jgi:toxin-antitoxin system PIN domain toxin
VKVVDANVLLYAVNAQSRQHENARGWLTAALNGDESIAFAWVSILAFVRVATHSRIFTAPLSPARAFEYVDDWLAQPPAMTIEPTIRHPGVLRGLLEIAGTGGNLTNDAHLAAIAIEHGAEVVTFDRDFRRFGVRLQVPSV